MKWLRNFGLFLAGILLAVGFSMIGRGGRRQVQAERRELEHLADGSGKALAKASKENKKAAKFKEQAKEAKERGELALGRAGGKDESIGSMLDRYRRV